MKYAWVMKVVPPWTGLVIGWFLAIGLLHQGGKTETLWFFILPPIFALLGWFAGKALLEDLD